MVANPCEDTNHLSNAEEQLKCDIEIHWCRNSLIAGVAWILRDWNGMVLLHS